MLDRFIEAISDFGFRISERESPFDRHPFRDPVSEIRNDFPYRQLRSLEAT